MTTNYTEQEVRNMRNLVYGSPISDKEWENCKDKWMQPSETEWLVNQVTKKKP